MALNKLHIILTSYNRPFFLRRALDSLIAQTNPHWTCWLMDDNSNDETKAVIERFQHDPRFIIRYHDTTENERRAGTRYSILINSILPRLRTGVIGFMCDNVVYKPDLVERVLSWFSEVDSFAGYVSHGREAWTVDGERLGGADYFNHWNRTPPFDGGVINPAGFLDHSQVFHRLPCDVFWPEEREHVKQGDAVYFTRLVQRHGPIMQVTADCLTSEALFE